MQTALHILSLVKELRREFQDGTVLNLDCYRKERAAFLLVKQGKTTSAMGFVFHPAGAGCYLVPARKAAPDTREKPRPTFNLSGANVTGVDQPELDRLFSIGLEKEGKSLKLVVEAMGPNGNLWLLHEDDRIEASLRPKDIGKNQIYQSPPKPPGVDPRGLLPDQLQTLFASRPDSSLPVCLERGVTGFNRTLAMEAIKRADLDFVDTSELSPDDLLALRNAVREIAERFEQAETGYLYVIRGGLEAYPFKLSSRDDQPEKLKTLSLAVKEVIDRRQVAREEESEQQQVVSAVTRAVKRLQRRLKNLEKDIAEAADYETAKRHAELLQINRDKIERGMAQIELEDVYQSGEMVTIKLDPAATPNDNIERYFQKYRKGREGLATLERRREISEGELGELKRMLSALETNFESARNRFEAELLSLLPKESTKRETLPRLPYREHTLSTGATIFIGRDGSDNDRTTFEFAKAYELWFHTQQCPGSHVVLKYPNKSFEPSKQEIEETAAIAAWHSKARNDTLVPVIYTERRYVRKPRKAKPGLVTVEREKSVMVEPKKPE